MSNNETKQLILLSDILDNFLKKQLVKESDQWFAVKLWQHWPQLTTQTTLQQTKPISYQKGRLVVWVAHSVELQELSFYIEELKDKINSHFKKQWITDIHFTLNKDLLKKREKSMKFFQELD